MYVKRKASGISFWQYLNSVASSRSCVLRRDNLQHSSNLHHVLNRLEIIEKYKSSCFGTPSIFERFSLFAEKWEKNSRYTSVL